MIEYKKHKFNIFPEVIGEDYERLKADLKNNGYDSKQPIYLYHGAIIDGWNRYKICNELGITPVFERFEGTDTEAVQYVLRTNKRRNLNSGQWAAIANEAEEIIEAIEKDVEENRRKAQAETLKESLSKKASSESLGEKIPPNYKRDHKKHEQSKTRTKLAETFNTNPRYISDAKRLRKENPDAYEKVKSGKKTISEVKKEEKKAERQEAHTKQREELKPLPLPDRKYAVIYADPPWRYEHQKAANRDIENQYPTMSIDDLCNIKPPSHKDCVLYLWVTAPKVPEAMQLIKEWGFNYKTCAAWDKGKIGMGYWFRGQHELLFVATKGNVSPPDPEHRVSSMLSYKRTAHSAKPHEVYEIIENAFPNHSKVEIFARNERNGWDSWGNQL